MTREFIKQKEIQIQYLNLVKNDNINPWMNILKSAAQSQAQVLMPLSCHFYLHNERSKAAYRYKTQMSMAPMLEDEGDEARVAERGGLAGIAREAFSRAGRERA